MNRIGLIPNETHCGLVNSFRAQIMPCLARLKQTILKAVFNGFRFLAYCFNRKDTGAADDLKNKRVEQFIGGKGGQEVDKVVTAANPHLGCQSRVGTPNQSPPQSPVTTRPASRNSLARSSTPTHKRRNSEEMERDGNWSYGELSPKLLKLKEDLEAKRLADQQEVYRGLQGQLY